MAAGAVAISLSSTSENEYSSWKEAAHREARLYGIHPEYVTARMAGHEFQSEAPRRGWVDWLLIVIASAIFVAFAGMAGMPHLAIQLTWLSVLSLLMLLVLVAAGLALWRVTKFN
jgi:hypothetical protein